MYQIKKYCHLLITDMFNLSLGNQQQDYIQVYSVLGNNVKSPNRKIFYKQMQSLRVVDGEPRRPEASAPHLVAVGLEVQAALGHVLLAGEALHHDSEPPAPRARQLGPEAVRLGQGHQAVQARVRHAQGAQQTLVDLDQFRDRLVGGGAVLVPGRRGQVVQRLDSSLGRPGSGRWHSGAAHDARGPPR